MTWPLSFNDHASSLNFPRAEKFNLDLSVFMGQETKQQEPRDTYDYTNYREGICVGYRWFDKEQMQVSYPFGYGLSYTTFEYSNAKAETVGDDIVFTVDVKNVGGVEAKEVVELYASAPKGSLDKPVQELKAYAKTAALAPGQTERVTLKFAAADLASFDEAQSAWVVDAGTYKLSVGASSRDIRATANVKVGASKQTVNKAL